MSDTSVSPDAPANPEVTDTDTTDWKAEAEKYKALHRKQEERAKANADAAKQLADLKQQSMSDLEKAVETARNEARQEAVKQVGGRLVDAEVRAAAAGRNIDVKALLDGLDRARFLTDDGDPDVEAIGKWIDRIAPAEQEQRAPRVPSGPRGPSNPQADPAQEFAKFIDGHLKR